MCSVFDTYMQLFTLRRRPFNTGMAVLMESE